MESKREWIIEELSILTINFTVPWEGKVDLQFESSLFAFSRRVETTGTKVDNNKIDYRGAIALNQLNRPMGWLSLLTVWIVSVSVLEEGGDDQDDGGQHHEQEGDDRYYTGPTGSPVIHGRVFWYFVKSALSGVGLHSSVH